MNTFDKIMVAILIVGCCTITTLLNQDYTDRNFENLRVQMINQRTADAIARVEAEGSAELERLRCKEQWLRSDK